MKLSVFLGGLIGLLIGYLLLVIKHRRERKAYLEFQERRCLAIEEANRRYEEWYREFMAEHNQWMERKRKSLRIG